jgi:hypothetical protein
MKNRGIWTCGEANSFRHFFENHESADSITYPDSMELAIKLWEIFDGDVLSPMQIDREIDRMHLACLPDPFLERKLWCSDFEIFEHSTYLNILIQDG